MRSRPAELKIPGDIKMDESAIALLADADPGEHAHILSVSEKF